MFGNDLEVIEPKHPVTQSRELEQLKENSLKTKKYDSEAYQYTKKMPSDLPVIKGITGLPTIFSKRNIFATRGKTTIR